MSRNYAVIPFRTEREHIRSFVDFPYRLYENDKGWIPPSKSSIEKQISETFPGHRFLKQQPLLIFSDGEVKARAVAYVNQAVKIEGSPLGTLGMFESINDSKAAGLIIEEACNWLREQGCSTLWGPMNGMIFNSYRMMIQGFDTLPFYNEPYNKPYYPTLFEENGLSVMKRWHSGLFSDESFNFAIKKGEQIHQLYTKKGFQFRTFDLNRFEEEFKLLYQLCMDCYSEFLGFQQIPFADYFELFSGIKELLEQGTALFVISPEEEYIGFSITLPDYHHAYKAMAVENNKNESIPSLLQTSKILNYLNMHCGLTKEARIKYSGIGATLPYLALIPFHSSNKPLGISLMAEGSASHRALKRLPLNNRVYALFQKKL